jgi:hypothetical protein
MFNLKKMKGYHLYYRIWVTYLVIKNKFCLELWKKQLMYYVKINIFLVPNSEL